MILECIYTIYFYTILYTYLYWLVELPLVASEIIRNHMFPGWRLGFPAKIPQSILLLRLLRSLKSRQNLPWFFSPRLFLCFFWLHVQLNPPIYGTKRPVQCQMVKRPGQAHLSGGHSSAQQLPCGRCRAGRPGRSRLRQLIVCPHWWVTVGWLVNGDLTWFNPQKWWFYMILTTKN